MSRKAGDFSFIDRRENVGTYFSFFRFCVFLFSSYDMRHKYMTFVMLICVSVCFLWFCGGVFGVRKAFIWFGCVW
jgi:hypothetical protein